MSTVPHPSRRVMERTKRSCPFKVSRAHFVHGQRWAILARFHLYDLTLRHRNIVTNLTEPRNLVIRHKCARTLNIVESFDETCVSAAQQCLHSAKSARVPIRSHDRVTIVTRAVTNRRTSSESSQSRRMPHAELRPEARITIETRRSTNRNESTKS